jgi:DNA-entry nuclease
LKAIIGCVVTILFVGLWIGITILIYKKDDNNSDTHTTSTIVSESAQTTASGHSSSNSSGNINTDNETVAFDFNSDYYTWTDDTSVYLPSYYSGDAFIEVNDNKPYFTVEDITTEEFETYSELDSLGRCGAAFANISPYTMPDEERGDISKVKPSGWKNAKYDSSIVPGGYVYNRCHLIGYQLAGENDNDKNLITGTRYLNIDGMLDHENEIADYVRETGNHVMYRVTPVYEGDNLVADGVLMEAYSVEDNGAGVQFNIYAYNIQPGIEIDYSDGSNWQSDNDDVQVHFETNK